RARTRAGAPPANGPSASRSAPERPRRSPSVHYLAPRAVGQLPAPLGTHASVASGGLATRRVRALANASTTPRARPRPTSTTNEPASSPQVGRSLRTSQAVMIPITGTRSVNGATVEAGYRDISQYQTP